MATIIQRPSPYCFSGNPMVYLIETSFDRVDFSIEIGDRSEKLSLTAYQATGFVYFPNRVRVDISDIVRSFTEDKTLTITAGDIIHTVDNFAFDCIVKITDQSGSIYSLPRVFRGGITSKAITRLISAGRDMFSYRLNNPVYNPIFTTRTNGHHLVLRETELYPFVFVHPGKPVSFVTVTGRIITQSALPYRTICSIDINAVRQMFAHLYGELPSYIVVQVDREFSFDVTVTPAQISEESFQLLFKNSLGAFEVIEVTGKAYEVPEFSEENLWQSLNGNNFFEENRDRLAIRDKYEVESGYKSQAELNFIKDLIASDEIYFIDGDIRFRCHVTVDQLKIARRMVTPNSIPLQIRSTVDEQFHSPDIDFSFPDNHPLSNITRASDTHINGLGLIYGDDTFLYADNYINSNPQKLKKI